MPTYNLQVPTIGNPDSSEDPKVASDITTIQSALNGGLDAANFTPATNTALGLNTGSTVSRGSNTTFPTETYTGVGYGLTPTPDRVSNILLPSPGLLHIWFQSFWLETVANAGRAAIFLNSTQLQITGPSGAWPTNQEAYTNTLSFASVGVPLTTSPGGLVSGVPINATQAGASPFTGMVLGQAVFAASVGSPANYAPGGACVVLASAGTYTVTVQYKAASGSVLVANRQLFVRAEGF